MRHLGALLPLTVLPLPAPPFVHSSLAISRNHRRAEVWWGWSRMRHAPRGVKEDRGGLKGGGVKGNRKPTFTSEHTHSSFAEHSSGAQSIAHYTSNRGFLLELSHCNHLKHRLWNFRLLKFWLWNHRLLNHSPRAAAAADPPQHSPDGTGRPPSRHESSIGHAPIGHVPFGHVPFGFVSRASLPHRNTSPPDSLQSVLLSRTRTGGRRRRRWHQTARFATEAPQRCLPVSPPSRSYARLVTFPKRGPLIKKE